MLGIKASDFKQPFDTSVSGNLRSRVNYLLPVDVWKTIWYFSTMT
jgi:hypothetical protein